jgi:hypothetical protein
MRDGDLRGALSQPATPRQIDVLDAYVATGGSVFVAAKLVGHSAKHGQARPSATSRTCALDRVTTEQLIYVGRAAGWLVVPNLEPQMTNLVPRRSSLIAPS